MPENKQGQDEVLQTSRELEQRIQVGLQRAVEAITGDAEMDPLGVFPNPADKERREDIEFPAELTDEQEAAFRSSMAELGIGRTTNRDAEAVGLASGYTALLEGGQGHKMRAELNLVLSSSVRPKQLILSGDTGRGLPKAESDLTARVLGIDEATVGKAEADVAAQVLTTHPDFQSEEPEVLAYGYTQDGELTNEQTGQFVRVGNIGGIPAIVMRIDRELNDPEDSGKGFRRPNNLAKMMIVSQIDGVEEIGFATSSTYQPSIEIDAIRAGLNGVIVKVPTYGSDELAHVKQEPQKAPDINQLASEAYKTAQQLRALQAERGV